MKLSDLEQLYRNMGREVPAEFAAAKVTKYNSRKKIEDGHLFDSTSEALAYRVLRQWEQHGVISELSLQPSYLLQPGFRKDGKWIRAIHYIADFVFMKDGQVCIVDVKGFETPVFKMKAKMFAAKYPELKLDLWTPAKVRELARQ